MFVRLYLAMLLVCLFAATSASAADPIVLASCTATSVVGWTNPNDCTQPLTNPDAGWASTDSALAAPTEYFEQTFTAPAGTYHVWVRLRAAANSKWNDSLWLQFSDALDLSGHAVNRIGTTNGLLVNLATDSTASSVNGWGWQDGAYWLSQATTIKYGTTGSHTIRVQVREDGASVDEIVLSSGLYLNTSPGVVTNDATRLAPPATQTAPAAVTTPAPAAGATNVATSTALGWAASATATSYDVAFGTSATPAVVSSNQTATSYQPAALLSSTKYYWQVIAKNAAGSTPGPVWSFTTAAPVQVPPAAVTTPVPAAGATNVATSTALGWAASATATSYDVAFGTSATPAVVSSNQTATSYQPAALLPSTKYYWQVTAKNAGGSTPGPVWSFTTAAPAPVPPAAVTTPVPSASATNVVTSTALSWAPSATATSYDVAFGTTPTPTVVSNNQTTITYQPAALAASTTYYWQVTAKNAGGATPGPVWSFTTAAPAPVPPAAVTTPVPSASATNVVTSTALGWAPSATATSYDVAFGTTPTPAVVASNQTPTTYQPATLAATTTYYWQVIAKNAGGSTPGPVWSFTTAAPAPVPPAAVTTPVPSASATNVVTSTALSWAPSATATSYDVAFGTTPTPAVVSNNQTTFTYQPAALAASTTYYWQVTAKNAGGSTPGPVWSFTTAAPAPVPPAAVTTPVPSASATNVVTSTALSWAPSATATSYDVALGTSATPAIVSSGLTSPSYLPAPLSAGTRYYWQVVAKNAGGATPGPVWSFTTAAPPPVPPSAVSSPSPATAAAGVATTTSLTWGASSGATSYDVAFGTTPTPPVVANTASTGYQPANLAPATMYYWQVTAKNVAGSTAGPIWSFTTAALTAIVGDVPTSNNTVLPRLRVFNWNVAQGYSPATNLPDYAAQIDLIASESPDVVTLQEMSYADADMMTLFINGLTSRTGHAWHGYYQRTNTETTPTTDNTGSAILTWLPVDAEANTLLMADPLNPFEALQIQVTVNGVPLHVSTAHLYAWDAAVRKVQLAALQAWESPAGPRRIIAGDFNAFPGETATWTPAWTSQYTDSWITATSWVQPTNDAGYTFDKRTATQVPERIDYQWTAGVTVDGMSVLKTRHSDHHALVTDYLVR